METFVPAAKSTIGRTEFRYDGGGLEVHIGGVIVLIMDDEETRRLRTWLVEALDTVE